MCGRKKHAHLRAPLPCQHSLQSHFDLTTTHTLVCTTRYTRVVPSTVLMRADGEVRRMHAAATALHCLSNFTGWNWKCQATTTTPLPHAHHHQCTHRKHRYKHLPLLQHRRHNRCDYRRYCNDTCTHALARAHARTRASPDKSIFIARANSADPTATC